MPLVSFYIPLKTPENLRISGGIEKDQLHEIGWTTKEDERLMKEQEQSQDKIAHGIAFEK